MTRRTIGNLLTGGRTRNLRLIMATAAACLAAAAPAGAQQPQPRRIAGLGDLEYPEQNPLDHLPVYETDIAAGTDRVMAIYNIGLYTADPKHVGYAFATDWAHRWMWRGEAVVPYSQVVEGEYPADPTVAYDTVTGNFVLAAGKAGVYLPIFAIWDAQLEDFVELPSGEGGKGWAPLKLPGGSDPPRCDKPTIVAGEVIPPTNGHAHQEFYICYFNPMGGAACYLRSTDGGYTWYGDVITVDEVVLRPANYAYPAAHGRSPLYVGYQGGPWEDYREAFGFVEGQDPSRVPDPMTWSYLDTDTDPNNGTLRVGLYARSKVGPWIPVPGLHDRARIFPQMAVDPADPDNVVYVVYHDTLDFPPPPEQTYDVDVDVFLVKLMRDPRTDTWSASERVRVNDPDPNNPPPETPSDQFFPNLTVTAGPPGEPSRIHVIFFDDRRFPDQPDRIDWKQYPPDPNFDVYYAYSLDGGVTFEENWRLFQIPNEQIDPPAVEYSQVDPDDDFILKDYIGIDAQPDGDGLRIWTSFPGTHRRDPTVHKSVIYSSQIPWLLP